MWQMTGCQFSPEVSLKVQCHEDFAVLGQFCAKIIRGFNHKQNASVKLRRKYEMNFIREG